MKLSSLATLLITGISALSVFAQGGATLEEVVVTAQRREQSLQEVSISVTAFTGEALAKSNIRDATQYLSLTPNVSFTEDGQVGSRGLGISLRGVNNLVTGENAFINSVGVYINEFSVASVPNQVMNPQLPDMQRIEVLRGPQGTYFGRNSVGGALNITTNKPTEELGGKIIVGGESYEDANEQFNVTGILNLPISDTLRTRGVIYYEDSGGLVDNVCETGSTICPSFTTTGGIATVANGGSDSGHDYIMGRFLASWTPTNRTTVDVTVIYTDEDQGLDETVPSGVLDLDTVDTFGVTEAIDPLTGLPGNANSPGFWPNNQSKLAADFDGYTKNESLVAVVNIQNQFTEDTLVKWISGVIDAENRRAFDNDLIAPADMVNRFNKYDGFSWSTELRMEMTKDRYDWVLGVLYAEDQQEQENRVLVGNSADVILPVAPNVLLPPPAVFPVGICLQCNDKNFEVQSIAVFTDLTWHFSDKLDLIVGGRYTHDEVLNEFPFSTALAPNPTTGIPFTNPVRPPVSNTEEFNDFAPRFSAHYQWTDDVGVYATVSKGYKAGGTSVGHFGFTPVTIPFDDETLWNYEIGFKSELLDRRIRLNGSAFYADWSDLQVENFRFLIPGDLSSNFEETTNVDDAEAYGFELELLALVTESFTLQAGLGVLETEITCDCTATLTGGYVSMLKGLDIPKSPEITASVAGEYRWTIGTGDAWLRLEYIHRDGQFSDVEAISIDQTRGFPAPNSGTVAPPLVDGYPFRTPDYDLVNLRAGYNWKQFEFGFYVQNLLDEEYFTGTQENFGLSGVRLRPHPRTFGGSVSYSFGGI